jgi:hypothetical protein
MSNFLQVLEMMAIPAAILLFCRYLNRRGGGVLTPPEAEHVGDRGQATRLRGPGRSRYQELLVPRDPSTAPPQSARRA